MWGQRWRVPLRLRWLSIMCFSILWSAMATAEEVRLLYVGAPEGTGWHGIEQGLREANILGSFTGYTYTVTVRPLPADPLFTEILEPPPLAVVAAVDAETLLRLGTKFATAGVAVLNLTEEHEALRQACSTNLFHIIPSARMKSDAVAQWRQKYPQATVQAQAWHEDFTRFAARELNNRFRKAYGMPMDDAAWAGWAALKLLSEAVARAQTTEPARILAYLRDEMAFDGQKGVPQTFRNTGQLRQPLLIVENGKLVGEAPVRGVSDELDSLGLPSCK